MSWIKRDPRPYHYLNNYETKVEVVQLMAFVYAGVALMGFIAALLLA